MFQWLKDYWKWVFLPISNDEETNPKSLYGDVCGW